MADNKLIDTNSEFNNNDYKITGLEDEVSFDNSGNIADLALSMQQYIRLILGFVVISNFILIFFLKFMTKKKEKVNNFIINTDIKIKRVKKNNSTDTEKNQKPIETSNSNIDNKTAEISDKNKETGLVGNKKNVLFIIAHPDDEVMFFYPTLKALSYTDAIIHFLCLTNGDYYGLGKIRENEFACVMKQLNITKYEVLNNKFEDSMSVVYNNKEVAQCIEDYLNKNEISINSGNLASLVTFDEQGVTKHPNHVSCCEGLIELLKTKKVDIINNQIDSYLLNSYGPLKQYIFQMIVGIFYYYVPYGFSCFNPIELYKLMKLHSSQFTWLRKLHIMIGSYTYLNSYTKIEFESEDKAEEKKNN